MTRDVAILHDTLTSRGGASRVVFELARTFDAPVYAARVDHDVVPSDITATEVLDGWPRRLHDLHPVAGDLVQLLDWQYQPELTAYDTIIESTSLPGWYVPQDTQTVVRYVHHLPRARYDQFHAGHGESVLSRVIKTPMRTLDSQTAQYPDRWVANSDLVARRLQRYWSIPERDIEVVYPPVDTGSFGPEHASRDGVGYYLALGRLVDHKRVHDLVDAFQGLPGKRLVVAGDGPERDALDAAASENVDVLGYITEQEKRRRLADADALVMNAANEDFGMVPVEAFASGTPVLGVQDGFTQHQIVDGQNGWTFERGVENIRAAVERFERRGVDWTPERIQEFAERFATTEFRQGVRAAVETAQEQARVMPAWRPSDKSGPSAVEDAPQQPVRTDGGDS